MFDVLLCFDIKCLCGMVWWIKNNKNVFINIFVLVIKVLVMLFVYKVVLYFIDGNNNEKNVVVSMMFVVRFNNLFFSCFDSDWIKNIFRLFSVVFILVYVLVINLVKIILDEFMFRGYFLWFVLLFLVFGLIYVLLIYSLWCLYIVWFYL